MAVLEVWELGHVVHLLCLLSANLPLHDMWFESLVEVGHAYRCIDDCEDNQNDGDNGETGQTLSDREVVVSARWLVHASELEDEVGHAAEV